MILFPAALASHWAVASAKANKWKGTTTVMATTTTQRMTLMMKMTAVKNFIPGHPVESVVHGRRSTMFVMCVAVPFKFLPHINVLNRGCFGNT
jgi:hypothetical protein